MHVWRQFYFKSRLLRCGPKPKQQINEKKNIMNKITGQLFLFQMSFPKPYFKIEIRTRTSKYSFNLRRRVK